MPFKPDNHWMQAGQAGGGTPENPYDNATTAGMNDLNDPNQSIIDNNLAESMNINPNVTSSFEKPIRRRKSMLSRHENIEHIKNQIHKLFAEREKEQLEMKNDSAQTTVKRIDRHSSQTEVKQLYSTDGSHLTGDGKDKDNDIYHTRIQEGDNNLMFVCEPKTMKSCCKQVGNNNVMVNLHMSMITNSCQILHEDTGKVFQLDSEGEVWLEIKLRRNTSSDRQSNCSNISSDSNTSYGHHPASPSNVPSNIPTSSSSKPTRTPTEHSDSPPSGCPSFYRGEISHHLNNLSDATPAMLNNTAENYRSTGHVIDEYHRPSHVTNDLNAHHVTNEHQSSDGAHQSRDRSGYVIEDRHRSVEENEFSMENNEMVADNIVVYENGDSIFVQVETPERLSDYANLEECLSVKEALGRKKVKEFLESQETNADFDVSIIGWEYEKEPLYSLPEVEYDNAVVDEDQRMYDQPITRRPTRRPTLPPKPHRRPEENTVDISSALQVPSCWDGATGSGNRAAGNRASDSSSNADIASSGCGSNSNRSSSSSWSSNRTSAGSSSGYRTSGDGYRASGDGASDVGTVGDGTTSSNQLNIVYERTPAAGPPVPPKPKGSDTSRRPGLFSTLSYEEMPSHPEPIPVPMPRSPAKDLPMPPVRRQDPPTGHQTPPTSPHAPPTSDRQAEGRPDSSEWYHGSISNEASKTLLTGMASGSFLVRDASDPSGDHKFTLEFVDTDVVRRLKIIKTGDTFHLKESGMSFARVEDLIEEAMKTGIEVRSDKNSSHWRMIQIVPVKKT